MASLRPKIIVNKKFIGTLIAPQGERVSAMLGTSKWGPINTVTSITDLTSFINTFGDEKVGGNLTGIKGADLFFRNGGILKFVRLADSDADYGKLTIDDIGSSDLLAFQAKYKGTLGNNISIEVTANGANRNLYIRYANTTESYTNGGVGYSSADDIITAITAGSSLVTVSLSGIGTNIPGVITLTNLIGGDDGDDGLIASDYTTAFTTLLYNESFNYLLTPGVTTDATYLSLSTLLENRASEDNYYSTLIGGIALNESISTANARTATGHRLRVVAPSVIYTNRNSGLKTNIDGSYLACAYAGTLCSLDIEVSGTHETVNVEGVIINTSTEQNYYTKNEQEQLLESGISPIGKIGSALQMIRDVTAYNDKTSPLYEGVIVDIVDYVTEELEEYLNAKIGKPNSSLNRNIYGDDLDAKLSVMKSQGILEAFEKSTVSEGVSSDTIIVTVSIKPVYSTNFIELNITVQ